MKASASQRRNAVPVGTLWQLISAPLSRAILAVLHVSARSVRLRRAVPLLTRGGRGTRVCFSSPLLSTNERSARHLCSAFDMARYIDDNRSGSCKRTLFPAHVLPHIKLFERHATTIARYMERRLVERMQRDLNTAQIMLLPRAMRCRFFSRALVRLYLWWMRAQLRAYKHDDSSREAATSALLAVRTGLSCYSGRQLRYLCGQHVTFADILVAECIYFDSERFGECAALFSDEQFLEAFPDVVAWARAIRSTHYGCIVHCS